MNLVKPLGFSSEKTLKILQEKSGQDLDLREFHHYAIKKKNLEAVAFKNQELPPNLAKELHKFGVESVTGQVLSARQQRNKITVIFRNVTVKASDPSKLLQVISYMRNLFSRRKPKVHISRDRVSFVWDERPFVRK
jgi:hypothetical protein